MMNEGEPCQPPEQVLKLPPSQRSQRHRGVGLAVINFNTAIQTLRCLSSLHASTQPLNWVLVLDNASRDDDFDVLFHGCEPFKSTELILFRAARNLGFAAGSNFLIAQLLAYDECQYIALINNDAVAQPEMVEKLLEAVAQGTEKEGLAGGRMHRLHHPEQVDTLGISIYASLMPADRKSLDDPFIGPTGGCCIFSKSLIKSITAAFGYFFDPRYFCYCEDTDLVLRAILMGYTPVYVDQLLALHEGQASTGGNFSSFITYHGIRNTIWMQAKIMPTPMLLKYGILLLIAHLLTIIRYTLLGKGRLMKAVYKDAFRHLPCFWEERRKFSSQLTIDWKQLDAMIAKRFYRKGYLKTVLSVTKHVPR